MLGEGARWVKNITWLISISILIAFVSIGILISSQIIKGIDKSEKKLRASESRFRSLKDSNTIGIVSWRMDGLIEEANENFLNMLGYRSTDIESGNINWKALTPKHLEPLDHQAVSEIMDHGRCEPYEKALIHKEGHPIPVYIGASSLDGDKDQGVAFVMDLSERKNSEEQMRLAATVFASSNDGIMITDPFMHIISANQALCNMTGYSEEELVGSKPSILKSGHTLDEQYQDMWRSLLTRGHWQGDIVDRNKSGALIPMRISISSVKDSQQNISHFVSILSDISKRKAQEDHLRQLAHYDTLTGLPNRILLNDRIEHLLKRSSRNQSQFAILFFDLDNFKPVNDRYGHLVGDKLLQVVANRLTKNVRGTDTVTRLGGDEFVMLLEDVADRDAVEQIIKKTTDSLCTPCNIDGNEINISVSIGVSIYPEDGRDAESLLYHADIAMYDMKETRHIQRARTEKQ